MSTLEQISAAGLSQAASYASVASPAQARQTARAEQEIAQELRPAPVADTSNDTRHRSADDGDRIGQLPGNPAASPARRTGPGSTLDIFA